MRKLGREDVKVDEQEIIRLMQKGSIFIYPTDTIYGIGCNAQNFKSVKKIRKLKDRPKNPFSVIAPSIGWIRENFYINAEAEKWLKKLPGPYTFIMKLRDKVCVSKETNPGIDTLGVRMPDHWISKLVAKAGIPFVTTSVNKSGQEYMTSLEDLDDSIKEGVDIIFYEGKKDGKPSKIVDITGKVRVIKR
jgi:tRNA threonylcarbamoyl adenosine modification protein (Sua5/YciO/YrdC/YwlC family)